MLPLNVHARPSYKAIYNLPLAFLRNRVANRCGYTNTASDTIDCMTQGSIHSSFKRTHPTTILIVIYKSLRLPRRIYTLD